MIVHADSLPNSSVQEAEVCIVGAGPVGIQIARRLAARGIRVIVAESGEEGPNERAQDLNIGTSSGRWPGPLRDIRMRQLGGTMHLWGGNCRPQDPIDFAARPWVPNSGWPISYADMVPYFEQAHAVLGLGDYRYLPEQPALLGDLGAACPFEEVLFKLTRFVPGTRTPYLGDFSHYHRDELRAEAGPRFVVGANVCQIFLTEDRRSVESLYALTFQGREVYFRAKAYVFACGGIETARLLLASNDDLACGVGNEGDSVGRYFMEHPHGLAAFLVAHEAEVERLSWFSPGRRADWGVFQHRLRLTDEMQAREGLLNLSFQLIADRIKPHEVDRYEPRFQMLLQDVAEPERWRRYFLVFLAEQCPSRESRVTLGSKTDFFGMPQADVRWEVSELDFRTVSSGLRLLREHVFSGPNYRMLPNIASRLSDWLVGHGAHHMGTTRMSNSARDGVVDRDCRIHGLSNGFVAGSSVFATAGMANPMLTSLAIGFRLACHIESNLMFLRPPDASAPLRCPRGLLAAVA